MATDEFEPYVLCRTESTRLSCALWTLPDGKQSLALFLTQDAALTYRNGLGFGAEWNVVHPSQRELLEILRASYQSGIRHAVLDPDPQSASRLFDLEHVLREMGAL